LVEFGVGSTASISASADWRASLGWARANKHQWPASAFRDFVVGQPFRYALLDKSVEGVLESLRAARECGGAPSLRSVALGLSGLLPRSAFDRAMHVAIQRSDLPTYGEA
jgi:hypothetical protein